MFLYRQATLLLNTQKCTSNVFKYTCVYLLTPVHVVFKYAITFEMYDLTIKVHSRYAASLFC